MCCPCILFGLWRFVILLDDWLVTHVKPYHEFLFECVVRMVLPALPAPRPICEYFTYCCLAWPVAYYRFVTCRDPIASHKLTVEAICFVFKQLDMFDAEELAEATGFVPDWKRYMRTGKWPWDDELEGPQGDEDEDEDEEEEEEKTSDTES
ncbi:unnamed protein product [Calicophoron daubneyi]|uniref:Uncharacterized protein n=1 Tax=Calicophoron daubneyi TaxID=300641 RepID=A0AAV2TSG2_CALDB